jgi:predicted nuclease with RNAse H fold
MLVAAAEVSALARAFASARAVAVDAPAKTSSAPHRLDTTLSPKFQLARCAEIALGREHRSWVPWVAPTTRPASGWMETGFALYDALAGVDAPALEVFPYAGFRALAAGRRLPKKSTIEGINARVELLQARGIAVPRLATWSHDALDALLAALVARDYGEGRAQRVSCGHDDSAIWLPNALPAASRRS